MRYVAYVSMPSVEMEFECRVHIIKGINESKHGRQFYEANDCEVSFPQYELKVIKSPSPDLDEKRLHIHNGYVCSPFRISDLDTAILVWRAWAAGSANTIINGVDLNDVIIKDEDFETDWLATLRALETIYGITCSSVYKEY